MKSHRSLVIGLVGLGVGMFLLAYASVPLYSLFCKVTGYGGTTQTDLQLPAHPGKKKITVRFNADISPDLDWSFAPDQKQVVALTGEQNLAFYTAKNLSNKPIDGTATYNVTPEAAGIYFNKIQCFCFNQQRLEPGEVIPMAVSFFIDPDIENDPDLKNIDTITLSYTFFKVKGS